MSRTRRRRSEHASPREGVDFGPFRLTLTPLQLWRGQKTVLLQPRPLAVLRYFVEHPGTVISNEALRQAVWGRTVVSPTSVQVCVREVRKALGDETSRPRYIETVGREGYRFIGQGVSSQHAVVGREKGAGDWGREARPSSPPVPRLTSQAATVSTPHSALSSQRSGLVGREAELAQLHTLLEKVLHGERQLVFVTGEAGIGKTTLVDAFLQSLGSGVQRHASDGKRLHPVESLTLDPRRQTLDVSPWVGRGQCLEQYGEGEAYLPVLEAVGQLCQRSEGGDFVAVLRRYAPTWLLHFRGLVGLEEWDTLQQRGGAPQSQMLREMAEALEAVSAEQMVILVLEDLHVSDPSTVELVAYLAQRRARARLLIIGSYRPIEVILSDHPLRARVHELLARGYGQTIALEVWTEAEVATYLRLRLATATPPVPLARWVFERTDGNALFVVHMVEYLLEQQRLMLGEGGWRLSGDPTAKVIPDTLQHLILAQFHNLSLEQQRVLEVASVAGAIFTVASVAAGLQCLPEAVEEVCEHVVRRGQFLRELGLATWPDGTVSGQYGFRHALYPEVLSQQLSAGRRMRMHLTIGIREEAGYGERARERAAEFARHFAEGHDIARAVRYLVQAGRNALRWSAHLEAVTHFRHGLTLLAEQPETWEWKQQELWLQTGLGIAQMATKGFAAPEVEQAFVRAHVLCQQIGEAPELYLVVAGLWLFYQMRGELRTARQLAEQLLALTHDADDPALLAIAHANMQDTLYLQGELAAARAHGERALGQFAAAPPIPLVFSYGPNPRIHTYNSTAAVLQALGYLDQSRQQSRAALALARELGQALTIAGTLNYSANLHGAYGEWAEMQARAAELIDFATTHNLPFWWAMGTCSHGIALTQQGDTAEGIGQMQQGLAVYRAAGSILGIPRILGWLAEAYRQMGRVEEGLLVLDEAFTVVEQNGERIWEAELYRRKGELTLEQLKIKNVKLKTTEAKCKIANTQAEAEAEVCFLKAIAVARHQQAKLWELRAVMSLSRLWQRQGKKAEAHQLLAEIYGWFTEGFDTKDLQEAKALLGELL